MEVIKTADWIIDLGPEGGTQASSRSLRTKTPARKPALGLDPRVAQGTPEDIVKAKRSYTGEFLKPVLGRPEKPKKRIQAAE